MKKARRGIVIASILMIIALPVSVMAADYANSVVQENADPMEMEQSALDKAKQLDEKTEITSGTMKGTQFESVCKLSRAAGTYINFWVHNYAYTSVTISINGAQTRELPARSMGHVWVEATAEPTPYTFQVQPAQAGGALDIEYAIVQRNQIVN